MPRRQSTKPPTVAPPRSSVALTGFMPSIDRIAAAESDLILGRLTAAEALRLAREIAEAETDRNRDEIEALESANKALQEGYNATHWEADVVAEALMRVTEQVNKLVRDCDPNRYHDPASVTLDKVLARIEQFTTDVSRLLLSRGGRKSVYLHCIADELNDDYGKPMFDVEPEEYTGRE